MQVRIQLEGLENAQWFQDMATLCMYILRTNTNATWTQNAQLTLRCGYMYQHCEQKYRSFHQSHLAPQAWGGHCDSGDVRDIEVAHASDGRAVTNRTWLALHGTPFVPNTDRLARVYVWNLSRRLTLITASHSLTVCKCPLCDKLQMPIELVRWHWL